MAGKRELARQQTMAAILESAHRQLGEVGAAALSLRSVARDVGLVSSAVYRYVESRDELLTLLIIEAYDSLGEATERDVHQSRRRGPVERWVSAAMAIRTWALDHPHEYQLIYGTPVPGYAAPEATVGPAVRPIFALVSILRDAHSSGRLGPPSTEPPITRQLRTELERLADVGVVDEGLRAGHILAFITAWTQLFGLLGFDLTNQTRGMVESHDELFAIAARSMALHLGLT